MRLLHRLMLALGASAVVAVGLTARQGYLTQRELEAEKARAYFGDEAGRLAALTAVALASGRWEGVEAYFKSLILLLPSGSLRYAVILDREGTVLFHSDFVHGNEVDRGARARAVPLLDAARARRPLRQSVPEAGLALFSSPVVREGRAAGAAILAIEQAELDRRIGAGREPAMRSALKAGSIGMVLSLALAAALAWTLMRPIEELRSGARAIGAGRLEHRIPERRRDELGELAAEFNAMARKLAELDELKDGFLAQITHDLRNPLQAVLGYARLLEAGARGPLSPEQREVLKIMVESARYLAELIDNILDVTRLDAGHVAPAPQELPLRELAGSVADLMKVRAQEYGVALAVEVPARATVWADESLLRRVLTNLVSNALTFTPSGGRVAVSWERRGARDVIAVRDSGIGIPPERRSMLFTKFSQVPETKNLVREAKGTGLGLVICKQLVQAHGGTISFESEYKKGTTFFVTLPAVQA